MAFRGSGKGKTIPAGWETARTGGRPRSIDRGHGTYVNPYTVACPNCPALRWERCYSIHGVGEMTAIRMGMLNSESGRFIYVKDNACAERVTLARGNNPEDIDEYEGA